MRAEFIERDKLRKTTHSGEEYVRKCAYSDLMHYELQGLSPPDILKVTVFNTVDLKILRCVRSRATALRNGNYGNDYFS